MTLENFLLEEITQFQSLFLPQLLFNRYCQQFLEKEQDVLFPGQPISSKDESIQIDQTLPFCSIVGENLADPLYKICIRFHAKSLKLRLPILLHEELRLSKYINSSIGSPCEGKFPKEIYLFCMSLSCVNRKRD